MKVREDPGAPLGPRRATSLGLVTPICGVPTGGDGRATSSPYHTILLTKRDRICQDSPGARCRKAAGATLPGRAPGGAGGREWSDSRCQRLRRVFRDRSVISPRGPHLAVPGLWRGASCPVRGTGGARRAGRCKGGRRRRPDVVPVSRLRAARCSRMSEGSAARHGEDRPERRFVGCRFVFGGDFGPCVPLRQDSVTSPRLNGDLIAASFKRQTLLFPITRTYPCRTFRLTWWAARIRVGATRIGAGGLTIANGQVVHVRPLRENGTPVSALWRPSLKPAKQF